jgi:hypothetical protein
MPLRLHLKQGKYGEGDECGRRGFYGQSRKHRQQDVRSLGSTRHDIAARSLPDLVPARPVQLNAPNGINAGVVGPIASW